MKSKAAIKGHPIHPMLVSFPIGLWVTSLVCDIIYASTRTVFWYDMAWWTMAFGLIGALAAAVPGLIDYGSTVQRVGRARPTATLHMLVNLAVVAVFAINMVLRAGYNATGGALFGVVVAMSVLAIAAVSFSGWLGGKLVYHFGIGFDREDMRISMMETEREEAKSPWR